jgi:hypothetical protein
MWKVTFKNSNPFCLVSKLKIEIHKTYIKKGIKQQIKQANVRIFNCFWWVVFIFD